MKLTKNRYKIVFTLQTFLLLTDLSINAFSILIRKHNAIMLVLFILQDVCIILALSALLLTFFSTYVFQAGLVELLYDRFRLVILICVAYFILTTVVYIWTLSLRWKEPLKHNWSTGLYMMYIIQRFMAPVYYYFYKRAALEISDPRLCEDADCEQKPSQNTRLNGVAK